MSILASPRPYCWTRAEYHRLDDLGMFEGRRVELLDGQIFDMGTMNSPHATSILLVTRCLESRFASGYVVRPQLPLVIDEHSEPEPDIAVVEGEIRDFSRSHPDAAVLVVEVSDSSLRFDRSRKARAYARAGIPEYWIVDLQARRIEVCRDPDPEQLRGYRSISVHEAEDRIAPRAALDFSLAVSELLP